MRIESRERFEILRTRATEEAAKRKAEVLVCCGTGCLANGAMKVADAFARQIDEKGLDAEVGLFAKKTGCLGFCEKGPLVALRPSGILYTRVKSAHVPKILERTVKTGEVIDFITFARTEGRFAKQFDRDGNPSETLLRAQADRLANWRLLQELAGLR